jgi:hypothetical protein
MTLAEFDWFAGHLGRICDNDKPSNAIERVHGHDVVQ